MNTTVTPAMKAENVADNGIQRQIEGGDRRRRQDLPGRVVDRRRRDDARRRAEPPVTATT